MKIFTLLAWVAIITLFFKVGLIAALLGYLMFCGIMWVLKDEQEMYG